MDLAMYVSLPINDSVVEGVYEFSIQSKFYTKQTGQPHKANYATSTAKILSRVFSCLKINQLITFPSKFSFIEVMPSNMPDLVNVSAV